MVKASNVILIVSDTFRRDHLGCYDNKWVHTENLDSFAEESVIFDKAYAASFPTIPHRHDLFTGRYTFMEPCGKTGAKQGVFNFGGWRPLSRTDIILSQTLRQAGYTTMLIWILII